MKTKSWLLAAICIFLSACSNEPTIAQTKQTLPTVIPSLSGYDGETRELMELACVSQSTKGPVAYGACLNRQIALLKNSLGMPNLSGNDIESREPMTHQHGLEAQSGAPAFAVAADAASPGYSDKVRRRVRPNIVWSGETSGLETEIMARCSPSGTLLSASITRSSGNSSWDDAALRAVQRSDPMPVDIDGKTPASVKISLRPAG